MNEQYEIRKKWFIDRVGKMVYRNATSCTCDVCKSVEHTGVYVMDRNHATYLHDMEGVYSESPTPIQYFDSLEEVEKYKLSLQNNQNND